MRMLSKSLTRKIKISLYERFEISITRGRKVLNISSLPNLTSGDFVRMCSLITAAQEIHARQIPGSVAELGVFQGEFAQDIHEAFPDRTLYLFDTFSGFHQQDKKVEISGGFSSGNEDFSDTSVARVLRRMTHPERVVIRAGYFPDSIQNTDRDQSFAFVSVDTDLFKPIYDGLQFFYPRLSKGGYIFLHDYNNKDYPGVNAAVRKYCEENSVGYFPLVDPCGSAVITKG